MPIKMYKHGLNRNKGEYFVVQSYIKDRHGNIREHLTVREVWKDERDRIIAASYPYTPYGDTKTQLKKDIQDMRLALKKPWLSPLDIPDYEWEDNEVRKADIPEEFFTKERSTTIAQASTSK